MRRNFGYLAFLLWFLTLFFGSPIKAMQPNILGTVGESCIQHVEWNPDGTSLIAQGVAELFHYDEHFHLLSVLADYSEDPDNAVTDFTWRSETQQLVVLRISGIQKEIQILDTQSGELLQEYLIDSDATYLGLDFAIDVTGTYFAYSQTNSITVLNLDTGEIVAELYSTFIDTDYTSARFYSIEWSPDGQWIAAIDRANGVVIWDAKTFQLRNAIEFETVQPALTMPSLVWSPDSRFLAYSSGQQIDIWEVSTLNRRTLYAFHDGGSSIAWSPDGRWFAIGSHSYSPYPEIGAVEVFDTQTWQPQMRFNNHIGRIAQVTWHPGSLWLTTVGWDCSVKLWDISTGQEVAARHHTGYIDKLAWNVDGSQFAAQAGRDQLFIWDANTYERVAVLYDVPPVTKIVETETGFRLATEEDDYYWEAWNLGNETPDQNICEPASNCFLLQRHYIEEIDLLQGYFSNESDEEIRENIFWHPDYNRVAITGQYNALLSIVDISGQTEFSISPGLAIAWHPSGNWMVTNFQDEEGIAWAAVISIWDVPSYEQTDTLLSHKATINALAWNPQGNRLASGDNAGRIIIWDTDSLN